MGYSASGGPKGLGVITDANTPLPDQLKVIELIARVGNFRVETEDDRDDIAGDELYTGLMVFNLDTETLELYDGSGWAQVWRDGAYWTGSAWITNTASISVSSGWGSGWTALVGGGWTGVAYQRRDGMVIVEGAAAKSSWAAGNVIFTLPVGFRPPHKIQGTRCVANPSGDVQASDAGSSAESFHCAFYL